MVILHIIELQHIRILLHLEHISYQVMHRQVLLILKLYVLAVVVAVAVQLAVNIIITVQIKEVVMVVVVGLVV
ncbi:MAG: hypothetical protein EBZ77_15885 [Chitinophagia bacterium]|nr:hypothetical protein [Chitinophagia bacterium]